MKTKKQGFIKTYFTKPFSLLKSAFGFIPQTIPFLKKQKVDLDNWSVIAREKLKDPAKANFDLGEKFLQEGKYSDAITRFKLASWFNKEYIKVYFLLGKTYLAKTKIIKAKKALQKAQDLQLQDKEFTYFQKIYLQDDFNTYPSKEQSKEYFNVFASIMDQYYLENFAHTGIDKVFDLFVTHNQKQDAKIFELGCGRGFLGQKIKQAYPDCAITGLDMAREMIDFSKELKLTKNTQEVEVINVKEEKPVQEKTIYDFLIKSDFDKFTDLNQKYDVLLSRGFLNYQHNHQEIIKKISNLLEKDGIFISYIRKALDHDNKIEIRNNLSVPFFHNFSIVSEPDFINFCKRSNLDLITKQDFTLEENSPATIFVYKKSK